MKCNIFASYRGFCPLLGNVHLVCSDLCSDKSRDEYGSSAEYLMSRLELIHLVQWLRCSTRNRYFRVHVFPSDGHALMMIPNKDQTGVQCFHSSRWQFEFDIYHLTVFCLELWSSRRNETELWIWTGTHADTSDCRLGPIKCFMVDGASKYSLTEISPTQQRWIY